jgi:hypothetical protein
MRSRHWKMPLDGNVLAAVRQRYTPLYRRDEILHMSAEPLHSLHVDRESDEIQLVGWKQEHSIDDKMVLWFGSTQSCMLFAYEGMVGIQVYERNNTTMYHGTILDDDNEPWTQIPVQTADGWLYKITGLNHVSRVRLRTDADVRYARWEHLWTFDEGQLSAIMAAADGSVWGLTTDGRRGRAGYAMRLPPCQELENVDQLFDCEGRCAVSLHGDGKVMTLTPDLQYPLQCIVEAGCYLVQVQGCFVAMAGCFFEPKQDYVIVHDLVSGWCWGVRARGYVSDMQWTPQGQLIALSGNTVFRVGGEKMKFVRACLGVYYSEHSALKRASPSSFSTFFCFLDTIHAGESQSFFMSISRSKSARTAIKHFPAVFMPITSCVAGSTRPLLNDKMVALAL